MLTVKTDIKKPVFVGLMAAWLLSMLLIVTGVQPVKAAESSPELIILNWAEYIDPAIITAFEAKHGSKVKQIFFESDDARDQILLQTKGKGFDLIMGNGAVINSYRKNGWLQPVPVSKIPNLKYIEKRWVNAFEASKDYGVPYLWGTLGIAYRKDLVSKPITSWKQIFSPEKDLQGKILMVKSSRDLIGMALKSLGYSCNSENADELRQAEALLLAQRPYVARYGYIALDENSSLVTGEIVAATVYGGDALNVGEYNENITYVLPEEGGNIWVDYLLLSAYSKQPALAAKFLDFINQPKIAAQNSEELFLASPNSAAIKIIASEIKNNPVIYPGNELLSRSEFYKELPPLSVRNRANIFARVVR